jgi:hypothetical protein
MEADTVYRAGIYLQGDPVPIMTDLTTEQVLGILADIDAAREEWIIEPGEPMREHRPSGFARIPLTEDRGDVLIRPQAVSAIMPTEDTDD